MSFGNVEIKYSFSIPALPAVLAAVGNCTESRILLCLSLPSLVASIKDV